MKKIYSKITRERAPQFQIETAIYQDETGIKYVDKYPLGEKAQAHITNVRQNYEVFSQQGNTMYVECQVEKGGLRFPFISGKSYFEYLLAEAKKQDKANFLRVLQEYKDKVEELYKESKPFVVSEQFTQIFGEDNEQGNTLAVSQLNIDLTFDNMIITDDGQTKVIDYEWVFDCLVPLKFVYFRAVKAFFVKNHALLEGFVTREAMEEFFDVSREDSMTYENMNNCFMDYINGEAYSYDKILEAYAKPPIVQGMATEIGTGQAQVFINNGNGYTEADCVLTVAPDENNIVRLEVDLGEYPDIKEVRIDPLNVSVVLRMHKFYFTKTTGNESIKLQDVLHNGLRGQDDIWVFDNEDPQIVIALPSPETFEKVVCEFEILLTNMETYYSYLNPYKEQLQAFKHSEAGRMTQLVDEQRAEAQENNRNYERKINLLKDKLAYIEGTKAYQLLLKKKVEAISVWDEIK